MKHSTPAPLHKPTRSALLTSLLTSLLVAMASPHASAAPNTPTLGRELYEQHCGACHSPDANRAGPMHRGVFGRRVGQAPGFNYSKALKNAKIVWNEKTLDTWLQDPEQLIPGQQMFVSIDDQAVREQIVQFLRTLK